MRVKLIVLLMLIGFGIGLNAQSIKGGLRGQVMDTAAKKPVEYANVQLERNGITISITQTDDSGYYHLKQLKKGTYNLKISSLNYASMVVPNVIIQEGIVTLKNVNMHEAVSIELRCVTITEKRPLVSPSGTSGTMIPSNAIMRLPQESTNSAPTIRGSRTDGTAYYIEGVRVQNNGQPGEKYAKVEENHYTAVQQQPLSTFSIDVDKASYANVRRYLSNNSLPPADAVRVEELVNYFTYDVGTEKTEHPFVIKSEVADAPWNASAKLVHITLKAPEIDLAEAPQNNLTFLIDVSGSMYDADKLPLLKECMKMLTQNLRKKDKISIVVYAGAAGVVLQPTSGKNNHEILQALRNLQAGGSTAGGEGIELAYKLAAENFVENGNNRIILATDGDFNIGITDISELTKLIERKRETGIYLSVLGFGRGNINDQIMETLADKGNGNYNYIDGILEGQKVLVHEMGGTLFTVAKDVKIQVEFNPAYVKSYKLVGYENRMLNAEDFNNDKKDAGELGAGHCVTAIYEILTTGQDPRIDSLKYQQSVLTKLAGGNEIMNIKVRYKKMGATESTRFEVPVTYREQPLKDASQEMRFAVSVALFGLKLRQSQSVEDISYNQIIKMSKAARGTDENGYRAEFTRLVETAELLASGH